MQESNYQAWLLLLVLGCAAHSVSVLHLGLHAKGLALLMVHVRGGSNELTVQEGC